jgi:3-deoxy-manno-octulosonate cytidylyltransferase (CMP-KDO synthetase)
MLQAKAARMSLPRSVACAIPARYGSTRLPGKPLLQLLGKPMIQHVYERASAAGGLSRVVVLTDDERIRDAVEAFGGEVELTPAACRSGTDRIATAARNWGEDAVVNLQGDEPLIDPAAITRIATHLQDHDDPLVTLATALPEAGREDPSKVKVVLDARGYALYFSRAPIPHRQAAQEEGKTAAPSLLHIGIYGYRRDTLLRLAGLAPTPLERSESLEQLRALENGIPIRVLLTDHAASGVDTLEDVAPTEELLRRRPT